MRRVLDRAYSLLTDPRSFAVFSASLVTYNIIATLLLDVRGHSDLWEHVAAMRALAAAPLDPQNPYIAATQPTHLFTPYHLFWGLFSRLTSVTPLLLLPLVAGLNISLFLYGCRRVARDVLGHAKWSLALAVVLLFFWINAWDWSGFYHFALLPLTAVYPYWFSFGLSLVMIAEVGMRRSQWRLFGLVLGGAIVFVSHPVTGAFLVIALLARGMTASAANRPGVAVACTAVALGMAAGAVLWPYFPVLDTVAGARRFSAMGFAGDWRYFYNDWLIRLLPALLGVPYLVAEWRTGRLTFAMAGLLLSLGVFAANGLLLHSASVARLIVAVAFYCHLGLVMTLFALAEQPASRARALTVFAALVLALSVPQMMASAKRIAPVRDFAFGVPMGTHGNINGYLRYQSVKVHLQPDSVVMAPLAASWELPATCATKVVAPISPTPFMADHSQRVANVEEFFLAECSAKRRSELMRRWQVTHVLVPRQNARGVNLSRADLELVHSDPEYYLYVVRSR